MDSVKNKHGDNASSSSSTFTNGLFGATESQLPADSSAASDGPFASMFPPPSTVMKRYYSSEATGNWEKNQKYSATQAWSGSSKNRTTDKEEKMVPCHLSSSIYYGGQENYSHSSNNPSATSVSFPIYKKDHGGDDGDDPNGSNSNSAASRGNWWQGSLYY
ncbi:hypothetical protein LINGRAPRIM_LOCUS1557 [Linum grandiflorum]